MKKGIKLLRSLLIAVGLVSCVGGCSGTEKNLHPARYVSYLEDPDHGMCKTVTSGNMVYTIQLATPGYVAGRDAIAGNWDAARTRQRYEELKGMLFVLVAIAPKKNGTVPLNNEEMALYYGGCVSSDVLLLSGNDELHPAFSHFENNLGLVAHNTLITGFHTGDSVTRDLQFVFNDRYAGNPLIQAAFSGLDIQALPHLAFL